MEGGRRGLAGYLGTSTSILEHMVNIINHHNLVDYSDKEKKLS